MFPQLTAEQQSRVVKTLMAYGQRTEDMAQKFTPQIVQAAPSVSLGRPRT